MREAVEATRTLAPAAAAASSHVFFASPSSLVQSALAFSPALAAPAAAGFQFGSKVVEVTDLLSAMNLRFWLAGL